MSYARFSNGDVYVYSTGDDWVCCSCKLSPSRETVVFDSRLDLLKHLVQHVETGHRVPSYALDRLQSEIAAEY